MTTIFVTHDTDEALLLGDRIAVLQNGEICQVDQPENILKILQMSLFLIYLEV